MLSKVKNRILQLDELKKDIMGVFFFKGFSMFINYGIVTLILNIINQTEYGVWLTISSVVSWMAFMDFGLANGLKNKFVNLFDKGKYHLIRVYISSSIFTMTLIGILIIVIVSVVALSLDLPKLLNTSISDNTLFGILFFSVLFFVAKAITDIIQTYKVAEQNVSYVTYISFVSNLLLFVIVLIFNFLRKKIGLLPFAFIFSFIPFFISAFYAVSLLRKDYKSLQPKFKYVNLKLTKDVYKLSMGFFWIQVAGMIIFSTDSIIISAIFNPEEVTKYNLAYKLFGIIPMILNVLLTPYWPAISKSYINQEFDWIRSKMRRLLHIWLLCSLFAILIYFYATQIYQVWLQKDLHIQSSMNLGMLAFAIISSWNMIFAMFINSIGKIKVQLFSSIFVGLINIPLSFYLANIYGPHGVIWATNICLILPAIWAPLQYNKVISNTAKGIWNQ